MGMFSKIAGASATGGGNVMRDGNYKLIVENVFFKAGGFSGDCFIAEMRVIESSPTGEGTIANDKKTVTDVPVVPNKPGSTCSIVCNLTQHESAAGNAKAFVLGCLGGLGYTEEQITEQVLDQVCGPKQPLRGMAVENNTYRTVNKGRKTAANQGNIMTLNKWKSIAQTPEQVKSQREWLNTNAAKTEGAVTAPAAAPAASVAPPAPSTPGLGGILGLE